MRLLITGGAGYVGSHVVRCLGEAGHQIVCLDNLATGFREAVLYGELVVGDLADEGLLDSVLSRGFDAVLHFAASVEVPESVRSPLKYYSNNTFNTLRLLVACIKAGVGKVVFSSTAAVYGDVGGIPVTEDAPLRPINPYGRSKQMSELMLADVAAAHGLRYVCLRYFNVAGADPANRIGQSTPNATHLIKVACEAVLGQRELGIFGTDYPTADGTCVRDYVHVEDLATAHANALEYLRAGGASGTFNCGYGKGYSVREVLDAVQRCSGRHLHIRQLDRRPGDAAMVIANAERIRSALNWAPRFDDLDTIVRHALAWETKLAGPRIKVGEK